MHVTCTVTTHPQVYSVVQGRNFSGPTRHNLPFTVAPQHTTALQQAQATLAALTPKQLRRFAVGKLPLTTPQLQAAWAFVQPYIWLGPNNCYALTGKCGA